MVYKVDADGATVDGLFTDGNPSLGVVATALEEDWHNMVQTELVNVVESAGLTLNKNDNTQLLNSISLLISQNSDAEIRSASELRWDGQTIYFSENIEIVYRSGSGARRVLYLTPASAPSTSGEIDLSDGYVVVVAKDNSSSSPVTLTYQSTYSNLSAGEWAIVQASSLTSSNIDIEMILFSRTDTTPAYHYGLDQKTLCVVPLGHKYFDESVFTLGVTENKLLQGAFSQSAINANCDVSQMGNFTTASSSSNGFSNNKYMLDGWYFGTVSSSVYSSNGTVQQNTANITSDSKIEKSLKIILSTTGTVSGNMFVGQIIANNTALSLDLEKYKSKIMTFEFWLKSNKSSNVRVVTQDGVTTDYIEIDTGSGDETWRRYSVSVAVSASATMLKFWIAVCDSSGSNATISNNEYVEVTGARIHIGTERLGTLVSSYDEELRRCRSRILGSFDGVKTFNSGYSYYNINAVSQATWATANFIKYITHCEGNITDEGTNGISHIPISSGMYYIESSDYYLFDDGSTTAGGANASGRISVKSSGGSTTSNVTPSSVVLRQDVIQILNTTITDQGRTRGYMAIVSDIA